MKSFTCDTMYRSTWKDQAVDQLYYLVVVALSMVGVQVEEGKEREWKIIFFLGDQRQGAGL